MTSKRVAGVLTSLALVGSMLAAVPASASSGSMNCGAWGQPKTTGYGDGSLYNQYHWVEGSSGTYYSTTGNLTLYWEYRNGIRSWTVTAPNGGVGACLT